MSTEITQAALPVRARGTLEIIDTAMKLYRRYFAVLMGWSAISAISLLLGSILVVGWIFAYPLVYGAGACCIAAAVRGQKVSFSQVWEFTKPRYGALLLITFLTFLLLGMATFIASMLSLMVVAGGAWALASIGASDVISTAISVVGWIVATVLAYIVSVMAGAWLSLVPIIASLEDDQRGASALGRAWELMNGSWRRVFGLATLLGIAILAVMGIVGGSLALFDSGASALALLDSPLTYSGFFAFFFLFWSPIQTLIIAVLYLDLRVRKEALDLEWNSYASSPPPDSVAAQVAAQNAQTPPELQPASTSGYAPGSGFAAPGAVDAPQMTPLESSPAMSAPSLEKTPPAPPTPQLTTQPSQPPTPQIEVQQTVTSAAPVAASPLAPAPQNPDDFDFSSSFSAGASDTLSAPADSETTPDEDERE